MKKSLSNISWTLFAFISLIVSGIATKVTAQNIPFYVVSVPVGIVKATAYKYGTPNALIAAFDVYNPSSKSTTLTNLQIGAPDIVSDVSIENDSRNGLIAANDFDFVTNDFIIPVSVIIQPGGSHRFYVRASIGSEKPNEGSNIAWVSFDGFGVSDQTVDYGIEYSSDNFQSQGLVEQLPQSPLINVAVMEKIESNGSVGFVVGGDMFATKQFLIRVVGPSLANIGISNVASATGIVLSDGNGNIINASGRWAPSLSGEFAKVGAFPLTPGSLDSAIEINLKPGSYTISPSPNVVGGNVYSLVGLFSSVTGNCLIEVYEVP